MAFKATLFRLQHLLLENRVVPLQPVAKIARLADHHIYKTDYIRPGFALCREPPKEGDTEDKGCMFYTISELLDYSSKLAPPAERKPKDQISGAKLFQFSTTMTATEFTEKMSDMYSFLKAKHTVKVRIKPAPGHEWASIEWTMKHQLHLNPNIIMHAMPASSKFSDKPMMRDKGSGYGWAMSPTLKSLGVLGETDSKVRNKGWLKRKEKLKVSKEGEGKYKQLLQAGRDERRELRKKLNDQDLESSIKYEYQNALKALSVDKLKEADKLRKTQERMKRRGTWEPLKAGTLSKNPAFVRNLMEGDPEQEATLERLKEERKVRLIGGKKRQRGGSKKGDLWWFG